LGFARLDESPYPGFIAKALQDPCEIEFDDGSGGTKLYSNISDSGAGRAAAHAGTRRVRGS
jgi:hypothetical protein